MGEQISSESHQFTLANHSRSARTQEVMPTLHEDISGRFDKDKDNTASQVGTSQPSLLSMLNDALASNVGQQSVLSPMPYVSALNRSGHVSVQRVDSVEPRLQEAYSSLDGHLPRRMLLSCRVSNLKNESTLLHRSTSQSRTPNQERLRGRGPPLSLIGVLDSPAPLDKKACWDDPVYSSNSVIPIRIQAHLMELKQIDTVLQEFHANMWIQMKWMETLPEGLDPNQSYPNLKDQGLGKWRPKMTFWGISRDFDISDATRVTHKMGDQFATVFFRYTIKGSLSQKMDLKSFPFDHQRLQIKAVLWDAPTHCDGVFLSEDVDKKPGPCRMLKFEVGKNEIYEDGFVQSDAWILQPEMKIKQGVTKPLHDDKIQYTTLCFSFNIQRRWSFYFINFVAPLFLLAAVNFVTFFLEPTQLNDKMNLTLTILLTTVAFRFSMVSYIPVTSYMTKLDMYMVVSFCMSFIITVQSLVVYMLETSESTMDLGLSNTFNIWCGTSLTSIWVLFHIAMPFISYYVGWREEKHHLLLEAADPNKKELELSPL